MTGLSNARRVARGLLLCGCALWLMQATPADAKPVKFDIPAQDLAPALNQFGVQSGREILYTPGLLPKQRSARVAGEFEPQAALTALLAGSGLTFRENNGAILILRAEDAAGPKRAGVELAPTTQTAQAAATNSAAEEILVTAQKRQERLVDVPQSVSVLSSRDLERLGATQFRDFADTVPGLTFNTSGAGTTQISMRGVSVGTDISQTVGIYVDEIPYGSSTTFGRSGRYSPDGALFDIDRIEVLRGPQGTLYGAASMGGLIKYVSKLPSLTEARGQVRAMLSDTAEGGFGYSLSGSVTAPIVDGKVGVRASAYLTRDGGYIDNPVRGRSDVNWSRLNGGRLDLLAKPSDELSVRLVADAQDIARGGSGQIDYTADVNGVPLVGELKQQHNIDEPFANRYRVLAATVNYDFGPAALTSISSFQRTRTTYTVDVSPQFIPLLRSIGLGTYGGVGVTDDPTANKFTQEVRLASQGTALFDWVVGSFYTHENTARHSEIVLFDTAGGVRPNNLYTLSAPSKYEEYAFFGDVTWHINEKIDVTGGLRWAHNDQSYTQIGSGLLIGSAPTASSSEGVFTYLANARYHFNDHSTAYLRYATGYRPGGPNFVANDPVTGRPLNQASFKSDKLKSYEAGYKVETEDRVFGLDVAAYYIDWNNIQVFDTSSPFGGYINQGKATIRGGEVTAILRPVRDLVANLNLGVSKAKIQNSGVDPDAQYTAAAVVDYTFSDAQYRPSVGFTLRYVSDRTSSITSATAPSLDSYTTFDLRAGMNFGAIEAQLFARNLFDTRGQLSAFPSSASGRAQYSINQPRTIGVSLSAGF